MNFRDVKKSITSSGRPINTGWGTVSSGRLAKKHKMGNTTQVGRGKKRPHFRLIKKYYHILILRWGTFMHCLTDILFLIFFSVWLPDARFSHPDLQKSSYLSSR